ncbi:MAG: hypothetical protein IT428_02655 [Planctomycetaceae bacterium]|nr:hypothetical protein [Planctomycetaceae bacterium]
MSTLRFRVAAGSLTTDLISRLRKLTPYSIAEIRQRVADGRPLVEIDAFENSWQDDRHLLKQLTDEIEAGTLPFVVSEGQGDKEEPVSLPALRNLIQHYREIEIETARSTELELGAIQHPDEFQPDEDDDWTR